MRVSVGKIFGRRAAFTLMEVNLAIFIMAIGVLAMVSLYPLGYRESQQSHDDVRAAAMADLVLGQLTAALSSRNLEWDDWISSVGGAVDKTQHGWKDYLEQRGNEWIPLRDPTTKANEIFRQLMSANKDHGAPESLPESGGSGALKYALVAQWGKRTIAESGGAVSSEDDYSRVCVSLRATRRSGALMAQPLYYTEIHFQGDQRLTERSVVP